MVSALRARKLHRERIAEEQRIVRIEADRNTSIEILSQRVHLNGCDDARPDIGERTELQRDAPSSEVLDEFRIVSSTRRMPDPVDAQRPKRTPHAGCPRGFAGMRRGPQTERSRTLERTLEQLGRKAGLEAADANADDTMVTHLAHPLEQVARVLDPAIAHEIYDERNLDRRDAV